MVVCVFNDLDTEQVPDPLHQLGCEVRPLVGQDLPGYPNASKEVHLNLLHFTRVQWNSLRVAGSIVADSQNKSATRPALWKGAYNVHGNSFKWFLHN